MRLFLLYIFFFFTLVIRSQGFKTRHYIPNASGNSPRAFFEISPDNYIGAGFANDTSGLSARNQIVIMGFDSQGGVVWTKKYIGSKMEYLNNQFLTRCFYKKDNFLYYAGCARDSLNEYIGVFLKFNMSGDTLWQKTYKDTATVNLIPQMVTTSVDGGFLITGFFQDWINHTRQGLILKTDANGNELWRKKINKLSPNIQDGKAIIQDSATKKIVIVGYQYWSNVDSYDNILILDSLGNKIVQTRYTNFGGNAVDLIQTQDKKFVAVGMQLYSESIGGYNCQKSFAVKFDIESPNTPMWKIDGYDKLSVFNQFTCITELKNGDLLLGGVIDTIQSVWNGPNDQPANFYTRLTIVDTNGNIKWNRYYDYKTNSLSNDNLQGIYSINTCEDGSWLATIESYNFPGVNPSLFVKYDNTGCDSSAAHCATLNLVGIKDKTLDKFKLIIFPNPVSDFLNIETPKEYFGENVEVALVNTQGEEVRKFTLKQQSYKLDVSDLKNGLYLIIINQKGKIITTAKFIKD